MGNRQKHLSGQVGRTCRNVAIGLIAGVARGRSPAAIDRALRRRTPREQTGIVAAVIGLLALLSFFAAQFGWVGLLVYWLAVIVLVN
jgi:hypothetical protein